MHGAQALGAEVAAAAKAHKAKVAAIHFVDADQLPKDPEVGHKAIAYSSRRHAFCACPMHGASLTRSCWPKALQKVSCSLLRLSCSLLRSFAAVIARGHPTL